MTVTTRNTFGASTLGVLGIRGYFRPGTRTTVAASATDTTLEVEDGSLFAASDSITVGHGADQETRTVSSVSSNTLTIDALTNNQPAGAMVRKPTWVDLGIIDNWEPNEELEELNIEGARSGLTEIFDVLTISAELGYTFESKNSTDDEILALWGGVTAVDDVAATGKVAPISFDGTVGELLWVRQNPQAAKASVLLYHPKGTIRRDGQAGTPGEEEDRLGLTVTVTADEVFTIPTAIDAATPAARYGYLWKVPTADLSARETTAST